MTIRKIALEEHFMAPGFEGYSKSFTRHIENSSASELLARLHDFDELRQQAMEEGGIDLMVLSQTGPGVQAEQDAAAATKAAQGNNDYLARQVELRPGKYAGFAALPMHSPRDAANELTRAVEQLGFRGALIHGHTNGRYYDDRDYDVFWERLQALDVPVYLHPIDFPEVPRTFAGHPVLMGATWGWGVETGTHALRLLFGGVFDRYPGTKLVLGHMGEALPFLRWRFDSRFSVYPHGVTLEKKPSEYFGRNILITTSGVCSAPSLIGAISEIGAESVMFSVDYPYESAKVAGDFIEAAPISDAEKELVCYKNAERLLKLSIKNI